jgi:hypothetical protein
LFSIIEIVVITYIYNQNSQLFKTETMVKEISKCIEKDIVAAANWNFGIQSSNAFIMVQFVSVVFLAVFAISYALDKLIFQKYHEREVLNVRKIQKGQGFRVLSI